MLEQPFFAKKKKHASKVKLMSFEGLMCTEHSNTVEPLLGDSPAEKRSLMTGLVHVNHCENTEHG